jgi:hypothetical protein
LEISRKDWIGGEREGDFTGLFLATCSYG